ncbi:hypothetical protein lbkm_3877 [Lachnospiraceae bacterium KM106-2]|nr:hypothetical protein lbkm_3877 [Lachnospiraceae bacterium KM106-2]
MGSFEELRIVDNFYQTSSFFPMPTVLIGTLTEEGKTTLGSYSLVQPYYIAGKDYYAMLLCARNSSNTAQNLLREGHCTLNFVMDKRKYLKEVVRLGFPGDTPEQKMKNTIFHLEDGAQAKNNPNQRYPKVETECFQVFECTWMRELDHADEDKPGCLDGYEPPYHDFNGITSKFGAHFILRVDKILMKEKYRKGILAGVRGIDFPSVPVDYGYRDSKYFWISHFRRPFHEEIIKHAVNIDSVRYAADRMDDQIKFTDEACEMLVNVPRIFLTTALKECVKWARENKVTLITKDHMKVINDRRRQKK